MTNNDYINQMSSAEKAELFAYIRQFGCYCCFYHYERERKGLDRQCPHDTDCVEGYRLWLKEDLDSQGNVKETLNLIYRLNSQRKMQS